MVSCLELVSWVSVKGGSGGGAGFLVYALSPLWSRSVARSCCVGLMEFRKAVISALMMYNAFACLMSGSILCK